MGVSFGELHIEPENFFVEDELGELQYQRPSYLDIFGRTNAPVQELHKQDHYQHLEQQKIKKLIGQGEDNISSTTEKPTFQTSPQFLFLSNLSAHRKTKEQ